MLGLCFTNLLVLIIKQGHQNFYKKWKSYTKFAKWSQGFMHLRAGKPFWVESEDMEMVVFMSADEAKDFTYF